MRLPVVGADGGAALSQFRDAAICDQLRRLISLLGLLWIYSGFRVAIHRAFPFRYYHDYLIPPVIILLPFAAIAQLRFAAKGGCLQSSTKDRCSARMPGCPRDTKLPWPDR